MAPGQVLAIRLRGSDAARNVPASAIRQGHRVLLQQDADDGTVLLVLSRG